MAEFYASNAAYHAMTAGADKISHPQVRLLEALVQPGETWVEIGCGGGVVARTIGERCAVQAFDVSPLAIDKARAMSTSSAVRFSLMSNNHIPVEDNSVDGVYCFEVLEHVWNPLELMREAWRVLRCGGFMLLSVPNYFSLDMHLKKRKGIRGLECVFGMMRLVGDRVRGTSYLHIKPDLNGEIYPDCDMITALRPEQFALALERIGFKVAFWDTTYMQAQTKSSLTNLEFQRLATHWFFRHFGDHMVLLAQKG
jgi:ubiquinone/menaquinone biosynthesis C-methylase UbiE